MRELCVDKQTAVKCVKQYCTVIMLYRGCMPAEMRNKEVAEKWHENSMYFGKSATNLKVKKRRERDKKTGTIANMTSLGQI